MLLRSEEMVGTLASKSSGQYELLYWLGPLLMEGGAGCVAQLVECMPSNA